MKKKKKAKQRYGLVAMLTGLPTRLKARVGKVGELTEELSLKATLQGEA